MLVREEKEDHICYKGEWQDDNSRLRLHYHKSTTYGGKDWNLSLLQLEVAASGLGAEVLVQDEGERECDFNF